MDQQADAVTRAVAEPLAVPGLGDDVAAHRVELRGADAGLDGSDAGTLRGQHHLVQLASAAAVGSPTKNVRVMSLW